MSLFNHKNLNTRRRVPMLVCALFSSTFFTATAWSQPESQPESASENNGIKNTIPNTISAEQNAFFNKLSTLCGKSFTGTSVFPEDPGPDFKDKLLTMTITSCTDEEIRIPFYVGSNTSRTWIITKTEQGLLFKHDHRHKDGTPDDVTNYGGYANQKGNGSQQFFPADDFTAKLLPKAATNVWSMRFDNNDERFVYHLTRHGKDRYTAHFDLTL